VTTTGAPAWDVKAAATNEPAVMEWGVNLGVVTASTYGLGRSANTPTQSSTTLVQSEDPDRPAFVTTCAVTWSVAPTIPNPFLRRIDLPATLGAGIIYTFPRGLILGASGPSLVMWNLATNANDANVHVVVDE
jgi:hypothetical protein